MPRQSSPSADFPVVQSVLVAVRQTADAICDRWSLEIVLAAMAGETRYSGFVLRTGMASRLVASRLEALTTLGVLAARRSDPNSSRPHYELEPMGRALAPVLLQMLRWEQTWRASSQTVPQFGDGPLARPTRPQCLCAACGVAVGARDIELHHEEVVPVAMTAKPRAHRRTSLAAGAGPPECVLNRSLEVFGDKWGLEILICAFFRVRRFSDFRACTGISPNILADRLARLTAAGVIAADREGRGGYWLTPKGLDLYGVTVAIQDWADVWLPERVRSPVRLIHRACGSEFHVVAEATESAPGRV